MFVTAEQDQELMKHETSLSQLNIILIGKYLSGFPWRM